MSLVVLPSLDVFTKQIHEANKAKGFWGNEPTQDFISEKFMLMVTELAEVVEAHRHGLRTRINLTDFDDDLVGDSDERFIDYYNSFIKGSIDEELADVVIRAYDFIGWMGVYVTEPNRRADPEEINVAAYCLIYTKFILMASDSYLFDGGSRNKEMCMQDLAMLVDGMYALAIRLGIDLDWHILTKLRYNSLRGHKHGKKY